MAQEHSLDFKYDASGNRVLRSIRVYKISEVDSTSTKYDMTQQNENLASQKIAVYPNPTDGLVNIDFNVPLEPKTNYMLYEVNGTLIKHGDLTSMQSQLNLSNLGKGAYILCVVSGSQKEKFKIVKQ